MGKEKSWKEALDVSELREGKSNLRRVREREIREVGIAKRLIKEGDVQRSL